MKFLLKQVKIPDGWRTTAGVLPGISLVGVVAGYGVWVLILWALSAAVVFILLVGYLASSFLHL